MSDAFTIALVQTRLAWREPVANRRHLAERIAAAAGADLVVVPETFTTGFLGETPETDEGMDGPTVAWLREQAAASGAAIAGSAAIAADGGRRNRFLCAEPGGRVHHYDKRHLFSFAGEDRRYAAGAERVVFDYAGWRICPQICYDIRFPVWCRVRGDYDLLLVVANWPARRVAAWDALLRARAIENQCFVAAVNRVGEDGNGVVYPGHSAVYDPFGEALIAPFEADEVRAVTVDLGALRAARADFPFAREADEFELKT